MAEYTIKITLSEGEETAITELLKPYGMDIEEALNGLVKEFIMPQIELWIKERQDMVYNYKITIPGG